MKATADISTDDLENLYKSLVQRRDAAQRLHDVIEAEYNARKRQLKEKLDQARKDGFDPDKMQEEIKHNKEVIALKINTLAAEIDEAEKLMRPMKQAIEGV